MSSPSTNATTSAPRLRRTLTLSDLILYGIIVIQPVAPMSVFGVLSDRGRGHVVTTLLIAMVAMLFTAFSYGRMARAYPSAGSAFTYVGQEINPALGYVTGWSMVMDYMLNPMICIIWCSQQAHVFAPGVPYWIGPSSSRPSSLPEHSRSEDLRASEYRACGRHGRSRSRSSSLPQLATSSDTPHDGAALLHSSLLRSATVEYQGRAGRTSIAVLTYIGFDGISTLSEEAENPRRNILLATVLTCL